MSLNKQSIKNLIAFAVVMIAIGEIFAQPGGSPFGGGQPACWPPPCIPIDGGLGFLVAAGIAFGGKKLIDLRSK